MILFERPESNPRLLSMIEIYETTVVWPGSTTSDTLSELDFRTEACSRLDFQGHQKTPERRPKMMAPTSALVTKTSELSSRGL